MSATAFFGGNATPSLAVGWLRQQVPLRQLAASIVAIVQQNFIKILAKLARPIARDGAFFSINFKIYKNLRTKKYVCILCVCMKNQTLLILLKISQNLAKSWKNHENYKIFKNIFMIFCKKCENLLAREKR